MLSLADGGRRPGGDARYPLGQAPCDDGHVAAISEECEVDLVLRDAHNLLVHPCSDVDHKPAHTTNKSSTLTDQHHIDYVDSAIRLPRRTSNILSFLLR